MGVDAHELRGLTQSVEEGGDLRAAQRLRPVVILATHDWTAEYALGCIVVERNARVVEKPSEPRPPFEHVADRLAEFAARQADLRHRPRLDLLGNRA